MSDVLLIALAIGLAAIVISSFRVLNRRWRSKPENNWSNEAYLARQEAGSWAESELAPGHEGVSSAPSILNGIGVK